jgi:predicted DNA-binding transcriptional regulator AlpA
MADAKKFLSAKECASALGLEVKTFRAMVAIGDLPQPVPITGKRLKMWPAAEIEHMAWMISVCERFRRSTDDEKDAAEDED